MRFVLTILLCFLCIPTAIAQNYDAAAESEFRAAVSYFMLCEDENEYCEFELFDDCTIRQGGSTQAMVLCAGAILRYWDEELNWTYHRIMSAANRQNRDLHARIQDMQRKWIAYRDAKCGIYDTYEGSMWRSVGVSCVSQMTRDAVLELRTIEYASGLDIAPLIAWSEPDRVFMDLTCDGVENVVWPGVRETAFGSTVVIGTSETPRERPEYPIYELLVDSDVQEAVCGSPVTLEATRGDKGDCPILRVSDGMCDSVYLQWNREYGGFNFFRN